MQIERKDNNQLLVSLTPNESRCFSNVLNEVCHGFRVQDFDQRIGLSRQEASDLYTKLEEAYSSKSHRLRLAVRELFGLRNALIESLKELGVEEFDTRVGMPFEDAQQLGAQIDRAIELMGPSN